MKQRAADVCWVAALCVQLAGSLGCHPPEPINAPVTLLLTAGPQGGGFLPLGEQVAQALETLKPSILIRTMPSTGAVSNVELLQRGEADLGFTFADIAYIGFNGQLDSRNVPFDRLRGIAVLQLTPIALVARAGAPIRSPADLRGRRVSVGPAGSGTALTARLILRAFGLESSLEHVEYISFQDAATELLNGKLDAMFDNAINQSASVKRAIDGGARLIPIEGQAIDLLRRDYPFLKPTLISRARYPPTAKSVHTIGVDGLLICRRDLDETVVYEVTKHLLSAVRTRSVSGVLAEMDLEQASGTPIPLHPGAARYYRERELSR